MLNEHLYLHINIYKHSGKTIEQSHLRHNKEKFDANVILNE